jgi:hypothetical protein
VTSRKSFTVEAQWALQGKTLGRVGYRVLGCSTGSLSVDNFTEAIGRFSMGTQETLPRALPQVTISYLAQGGVNYLALAIHQFASDAEPNGGLMAHDDDGRPVVATSYYCVPYEPMADRVVSYQALYTAFTAAPLRPEDGPVLPVELPVPPAAPDGDVVMNPLAASAAALLLSGRPVCVLGATLETSMAERLGFIDAVMALLPYGFRSRMAAATWTRATNQNHRFRLFFSGARRDADQPDNVITWGRPERTILTPDDDYAYWYQNWLAAESAERVVNLLSGFKQSRSLANRQEVLEALDAIGSPLLSSSRRARSKRGREVEPDSKQENQGDKPGLASDTVVPARSDGEQYLLDCAQHMEKLSLPQLSTAISQLKNSAKAGVTPDQQARYRELIKEHRLFRHDEALGKFEAMLRETLLRVAFVPPIGYEDYCLIEDATSDATPDSALLQQIEKAGLADLVTKALVYRQLPLADADKKLGRLYSSKEVTAADFINLLARDMRKPRHMRIICDVTVEFLGKMRRHCDPEEIERVLRAHSYLARRLQKSEAGHDQYQINVLWWLLRSAYPRRLTKQEITHVMTRTEEPPTLPFLVAVLLTLADPEDAVLARDLYTLSSLSAMNLEPETSRVLRTILWHSPQAKNPDQLSDGDALDGIRQYQDSARPPAAGAAWPESQGQPLGADAYAPRHGTEYWE